MSAWKQVYLPRGLLPVIVTAVSGTIIFNTLPLFVGYVADKHELEDIRAGMVGSSLLLGYALATFTSLFWVRRVSWRNTASLGIFAAISLLAALHAAVDFTTVLVVSFFLGATSSIGQVIANAWIDTAKNPSPLFGVKGTVDLSAAAVAILCLTIAFSTLTFEKLLLVYGLTYCVCLITSRKIRNPSKSFAAGPVTGTARGWLALLVLAANSIAMVGFWAFVERLGLETGLTNQGAGQLMSFALVVGIFGAICAGILARHLRLITSLIVLYLAVAIDMMIFALGSTPFYYALAVLAFQFIWISLNILQMAFVAEMDDHGGLVAIVAMGITAGGAIGPGLAGWIRTAYGGVGVYGFVLVITFASAFFSWQLQQIADRSNRVASSHS